VKRKLFAALAIIGTATALTGCPGPTFIVQQYAGPERPRETIAILRSNAKDDAKLLYLDGEDVAAPIAEDGRLHIEVLPARHTVVVGRASLPSERYPELAFNAEADHVYRVVFTSAEPQVYEVDRSKDTPIRDVTIAKPPPPPPPPPAPPPPAETADAGAP
jgi:hypothetical protein